jgi:TetR/AcrR family transcriptional repressor of nem operon
MDKAHMETQARPRLQPPVHSKTRLLDAAMLVIRTRGYAGTTVDDICRAAGVTKGSFFHHFKSKDELAVATVDHFSTMADGLFATAPYHRHEDPLDRLLGYVDFRAEILTGRLPEFTCLLGTLVQETYDTHPDIRAACDRGMSSHVAELTRDVVLAKERHAPDAPWSAESVGYFIQSVLQGAFIFAKAKQGTQVARDSLAHLRRYLSVLFHQSGNVKTARRSPAPSRSRTQSSTRKRKPLAKEKS